MTDTDDDTGQLGGLPGPRDAEDAERMERQARDAERHISEQHERTDADGGEIYEE
jgi:hypothetical protein